MNRSLANLVESERASLQAAGSWRSLPEVSSREGATIVFNDRRCVNLSSNDYLGLGGDGTLLGSFLGEARTDVPGFGMAGSSARLLAGNHSAYGLLEQDLCEFFGGRSALVFNSGYHANLGVCSGLAERNDVFFADRLCHASLIDGMRLSGADLVRYQHLDTDHLASLLRNRRASYRNAFIVTESVFSMDGDLPDLAQIVRLKNDHDAALILDEAHAVGVSGPGGRGVAAGTGLLGDVDLLVGTFGKALGSYGAFVWCEAALREFLVNRARSFIFTTALPPGVVNWSRTTLAKSTGMDKERAHLRELWTTLRGELAGAGVRTGGETQIVPVHIGESGKAVEVAQSLQDAGFLVFPIRPPTVPPGTARLRLSLTADIRWDAISVLPGLLGRLAAERPDVMDR
jgi:8-amino-7-oxononanoate synthase